MAPPPQGQRAGSAESALTELGDSDEDVLPEDGEDAASRAAAEANAGRATRRSGRQVQQTKNSAAAKSAAENAGLPKRRPGTAGKQANGKAAAGRARNEPSKTPDIRVPTSEELENGNDDDEDLPEEDEEEIPTEDDDENDDDFKAPKKPGAGAGRGGNKGTRKTAATTSRKGKGRAKNQDAQDDEEEADGERPIAAAKTKDDFEVSDDNDLFNAVRDPASALEGVVESWVADYAADEDSRGEALAHLITFVIRCCGCNLSVDKHEAQDLDGVVDRLDEIQTEFAQANQATYPLISKSKTYKKFRSSIAEFFERLIDISATQEILYDEVFCETLQSWLVAASSSRLRAFRHTSTVLTLQLVEALCDVAVQVDEQFSSLQRQREAEAKKKRADKTRLKDLENRVKLAHGKKVKLETYFKDIFDAVFVHRYRDAEASIRMECIRSLGSWMRKHSDYFLEGNYLRYIGWILTDLDKDVRLGAVSALAELYKKEDYIASMQHFTERFKGRLVEMAVSEAELSVRCAAIHVLGAIDRHGLLDDDQKDEVGRLVFDGEQRVRRAASPFFNFILDETIADEKTQLQTFGSRADGTEGLSAAQKKEKEELQLKRLRMRCFGGLLVNYDRQTDERAERESSQDTSSQSGSQRTDRESSVSSSTKSVRGRRLAKKAKDQEEDGQNNAMHLAALLSHNSKDRITLAVEAMWHDVKLLQDWEGILDYLLLDHAAGRDGSSRSTTPAPASGSAENSQAGEQVDEQCRLDEEEETTMLSVLVASISTARHRASLLPNTQKAEADALNSDITRSLIKALPRLFSKHQSDVTRSSIILLLPCQMQLELYLDMRLLTAYEGLWNDVTKHFTSTANVFVLERAMETIQYLRSADTLSQYNGEKTAALEQAVVAPIYEITASSEIGTGLDEDDLKKLEASMMRLALIVKNWNAVALLEEKDGGNASSLVDIAVEVLNRGQVATPEEDNLVKQAMEVLSTYLLWKTLEATASEAATSPAVADLQATFVERISEYTLSQHGIEATKAVRRASLKTLLDLRIVAQQRYLASQDPADLIDMDVQAQYRCAGFIQAQIERYADMVKDSLDETDDDDLIYESDNEDEEAQRKQQEAGEKTKKYRPLTLEQQAAEYAFNDLISSFSRAICTDVIDLHHASTILAHYDSLGPFYNECGNQLSLALRHYGVLGGEGHAVAGVVFESLKQSLEMYLSAASRSEKQFLSLARQLSNHIVIRKGFSIAQRLPSEDLVKLHTDCINYVAGKLATFESQERATSRNRALVMFKGLTLCTAGMSGKEAAAVHAHMDRTFKQYNVLPSTASKHWEPQRAYDKKLVSLMSKDNTIKAAARKQVKTAAGTSDGEDNGEGDDNDNEAGTRLPGRRRVRPKPAAKARANGASKKADKPTALPSRKSTRTTLANAAQYAEEASDVDEEAAEEAGAARRRTAGAKATATGSGRRSLPSADYEGNLSEDEGDADSSLAQATAGLPKRRNNKRPREDSPMAGVERSSSPPSLPSQSRIGTSSGEGARPNLRSATPQPRDDDDLDSLAGVPDSPPNIPLSQLDENDRPAPGKKGRIW